MESAHTAAAPEKEAPVMSKRQQKKQAKKQERKDNWAASKAKLKEEKQQVLEKSQAEKQAEFDALSKEDQSRILQMREDRQKKKEEQKAQLQERMQRASAEGPRVLVDLDFDEHMTENEAKIAVQIVSLTQQLSFLQGMNAKAEKPFALEFCNVSGRTEASLERRLSHYTQWQAAEVNKLPYIEAYAERKQDLVYLTADAEEALEDLDASKIYIIGGIIDRNRHKLICSKKARKQNISMARLPLQEHFKLKGSAVLTIDQVFQLLLCYHASHDWKDATNKAIPTRKLLLTEMPSQHEIIPDSKQGSGQPDPPTASAQESAVSVEQASKRLKLESS